MALSTHRRPSPLSAAVVAITLAVGSIAIAPATREQWGTEARWGLFQRYIQPAVGPAPSLSPPPTYTPPAMEPTPYYYTTPGLRSYYGSRYPSYDPGTNTYQGNDGIRRPAR